MRLASLPLALTATALALATAAPATAAPATQTTTPSAQAAPAAYGKVSTNANAARWYTQRHEALGPGKYLETSYWKRVSGVRVMQVKARCWGNDSQMTVKLLYDRRYGAGTGFAKSGKWACNGKYNIVRISNAGHSKYYATFTLSRKHTVEYWVQYYK